MRAERHAALLLLTFTRPASGVTPCVSGHPRRFSAGRGKRPGVSFNRKLAGGPVQGLLVHLGLLVRSCVGFSTSLARPAVASVVMRQDEELSSPPPPLPA